LKLTLLIVYFASFGAAAYVLFDTWGDALLERMKSRSRNVHKKLEREFISVSKKRIIVTCAIVTFLTAAIFLAMKNGAIVIVFPIMCLGAFQASFHVYSHRRRKNIVSQISFFLDLLESHIKAGVSFPQALKEITGKVKNPLKEEIEIITGNISIGMPLEDALRSLYERTPSEETLITCLSISTCLGNGANMSEMVAKVQHSLVEKQRAEKKMRAQTSQGKLQGIILTSVPLFLVLALNTIMPGYFHNLISAPAGKLILAMVGVLLSIGWMMIIRIIKPEV
jgi:tight adherence protein B